MRFFYRIKILLFTVIVASCAAQKAFPVADPPNLKELNEGVNWEIRRREAPKMLYPRKEFLAGQEGWVLIRCDVSESGQAENLEVVDYSPSKGFVENALNYILGSKFFPYEVDGKPARLNRYYFLVNFRINNKAG